jgi:hypothetical protein
MTTAARDVPYTKFNGPISAERVLETRSYPLSKIKQLKSAIPGATINDVALALVAGALRLYLLAEDTPPEPPLIAGVPISIRTGKPAPGGTQPRDRRHTPKAVHPMLVPSRVRREPELMSGGPVFGRHR